MVHRLSIVWALFVILFGCLAARAAEDKHPQPVILLDDFETAPAGWKYIGGWEFPGAKGSLAVDAQTAHGGKHSYKLAADFTGGGAYVGTWRDLASLNGRDINELRLWIKAADVSAISVRLQDSSEQCHQTKDAIKLPPDGQWHEYHLKIADLVGGEHWGGVNDGKWHGPLRAFGLNIDKGDLSAGVSKGAIYLDDVAAVAGPVRDGHPRILAASVDGPCRPGFAARVTYHWDAEPMGRDYTVFVHFVDRAGKIAFQNDHLPATATSIWSGPLQYTQNVLVPADTAEGEYRIIAGLYAPASVKGKWDHPILQVGPGVTAEEQGGGHAADSYQIGLLKVDAHATIPSLGTPTLNLNGYVLTFSDEFNDLSVSPAGPGTRWFTATKGTFGDARFVDQKDNFPFTVKDGILRIEAARRNGRWEAGIMASVNPKGEGFSQQYGYFEMRAKFPAVPGMWPAFWLLGQPALTDKKRTNIEIDVVEHYGVMPNGVFSTMHLWPPNGKHWAQGDFVTAPGLTDEFHSYGVLVDAAHVTWYFDGIEVQQQKTPEAARVPLYMLVNLAMGGGWPIKQAVSPSYMYVDYVRAYAKR